MPYESGMDPVHDTRRRFDVRFHLLAIAFLVFDVELVFLYPWAVAVRSSAPAAATIAPGQAAANPLMGLMPRFPTFGGGGGERPGRPGRGKER